MILLVPCHVSLFPKGFYCIQFQSKVIKRPVSNFEGRDMSCLNLETECQAQIWHQTAPLEYQLWSISKAKRILVQLVPRETQSDCCEVGKNVQIWLLFDYVIPIETKNKSFFNKNF